MEYIPLKGNVLIIVPTIISEILVVGNLMVQPWFRTVSTGCNNKEKIYITITSKIRYESINNKTG